MEVANPRAQAAVFRRTDSKGHAADLAIRFELGPRACTQPVGQHAWFRAAVRPHASDASSELGGSRRTRALHTGNLRIEVRQELLLALIGHDVPGKLDERRVVVGRCWCCDDANSSQVKSAGRKVGKKCGRAIVRLFRTSGRPAGARGSATFVAGTAVGTAAFGWKMPVGCSTAPATRNSSHDRSA